MTDKTEEPSPRRLERAQREGDVPSSAFASQSIAFVCVVLCLPAACAAIVDWFARALVRGVHSAAGGEVPSALGELTVSAHALVRLAAPLLIVAAGVSAVASVIQGGGIVATKRLTPDLGRLDPFAGLRQLVTPPRLIALGRALVFGAAVAWLGVSRVRAHLSDLANLSSLDLTAGARTAFVAGVIAQDVAWRVALLGLPLAALDIIVTRRAWRHRHKMTKDEVRREHKESEGDPEVKAARARAHQEVLRAATIANVREATVVIVNPTHLACALRYDEVAGDQAPVVVAAGEGELAERIVAAAREASIPILRDIPLARALIELEIGAAIPEALYEAVAEVLRAAWDERDEAP